MYHKFTTMHDVRVFLHEYNNGLQDNRARIVAWPYTGSGSFFVFCPGTPS